MKKIFLFALAFPMLFASCSDDDDKDATIVGVFLYSQNTNEVETDNAEATASIKKGLDSHSQNGVTLIFNSDNTHIVSDPLALTIPGTWTYSIKGNILTTVFKYENKNDGESDKFETPFRVDANSLQLIEDYKSKIEEHPELYYDVKKHPNLKITKATKHSHFKRVK